MEIVRTSIPGCLQLLLPVHEDERGLFVKTYQEEGFRNHGLVTEFAEEYYTVSRQHVLRGLHFQLPPQDHIKLVHCAEGMVLDAVLDLRIGSPTYGHHALVELTSKKANLLYIPRGVAHGFLAMSEHAVMLYKVTTSYSPQHDTGIHWNSAGIPWPVKEPIVSSRDKGFAHLRDFRSPFTFSA